MAERLRLELPAWAKGVLVVADVHGHPDLFQAMIDLAQAEERFIVSLGDLVDRGTDNAATVRQMLSLLQDGKGLFIRGNHDDKLFRTLKGNPTIVDSDLAVTIEQLDAAPDGQALKKGFADAYRAAPYIVRFGDTVLVHGGFAPAMLKTKSLPMKLKSLALYGEATQDPLRQKPIRTYRWLDTVAAGTTVAIGHHPVSDETLLVRENARGGRLLHLDCGAGKGRGLGALRLSRSGAVQNACRASRRDDAILVEAMNMEAYSAIAGNGKIG